MFSNYQLFDDLIDDLSISFKQIDIDKIVCIDAIGFILGSALSMKMKKGLVLVRKEGKIPLHNDELIKRTFTDYSRGYKTLEINKNLIKEGEKILLVDDWIETGSQIKAAIQMVEEVKCKIVGISCIGIDRNENTEELFIKYNLKAIGINV